MSARNEYDEIMCTMEFAVNILKKFIKKVFHLQDANTSI